MTESAISSKRDEMFYYKGALEDVEYMIRTWIHDEHQIQLSEAQPDNEVKEEEPSFQPEIHIVSQTNGSAEKNAPEASGEKHSA